MSDLKKQHAEYLMAKNEGVQFTQDMHQKAQEVAGLKQQITEVKEIVANVERYLSNARKGLGMPRSTDELLAFKRELADKKAILSDLQDLLLIQNNALNSMKSGQINLGRTHRAAKSKLIQTVITDSAGEISMVAEDKIKFLINMILSDMDFSMKAHEVSETLYLEIGRNLCQQVFSSGHDNSSISLPQADEAHKVLDLYIESLA